jgi:hypothetical protein
VHGFFYLLAVWPAIPGPELSYVNIYKSLSSPTAAMTSIFPLASWKFKPPFYRGKESKEENWCTDSMAEWKMLQEQENGIYMSVGQFNYRGWWNSDQLWQTICNAPLIIPCTVHNAENCGKLEPSIVKSESIHVNTSITSGKQELKPVHTCQNEEILLYYAEQLWPKRQLAIYIQVNGTI